MIYRSLALVLTAFSLAAAARKSLSTVVNDCSFTLGGKEYDLCPLFNRENEEWLVEVETETPPTITKNTYRLALGGSLKRDGTLPDHEQVRSLFMYLRYWCYVSNSVQKGLGSA